MSSLLPLSSPTSASALLQMLHAILQMPLVQGSIGIPALLILADVVSGVLSAVKRRVFAFTMLSDFLSHDLAKYACANLLFVSCNVLLGANNAITLLAVSLPASLAISVAASILQNVQTAFPKNAALQQVVSEELHTLVPQFNSTPPPAPIQQPQQQQQQAASSLVGTIGAFYPQYTPQLQPVQQPPVQSPQPQPQPQPQAPQQPLSFAAPLSNIATPAMYTPQLDPGVTQTATALVPAVNPALLQQPIQQQPVQGQQQGQ